MARLIRSTAGVAIAALASTTLPAANAAETNVAVAANFTEAAAEIATLFHEATGHTAILSFGSSGQLYAQITQAAPFDILLSADQTRPALAVTEGRAAPDNVFTYAVGKLVLFSADPALVRGEETLRAGAFQHIAIANPATAPYGAAAKETLAALGLTDALTPKIVQGESIAQTYQFVATGNAELGFVALAQLVATTDGSRWIVPETLYTPIRQDAVLLDRGADNEAARAFMAFLQGPEAGTVIARFGYATDD